MTNDFASAFPPAVSTHTCLDELALTFIAPVDLSRLDIERKKGEVSDYRGSSEGLRARGYERHLTPREHFAVRAYAGSDEGILAVKEDMLGFPGEWLHASVLAGEGVLCLAPGLPRFGSGAVPVSLTFQVRGLGSGWHDYSLFPSCLVSALWNLPDEWLRGKAGIYLARDGAWRPVARSYYDLSFNLYADDSNYHWASRGVRRKGACFTASTAIE